MERTERMSGDNETGSEVEQKPMQRNKYEEKSKKELKKVLDKIAR